MGSSKTKHRPVQAAIRISGGRTLDDGTIQELNWGTLTGVATRNSDKKRMLVTNLHVMPASAEFSHRC